jgi:predicted nucleic acid-binding protein
VKAEQAMPALLDTSVLIAALDAGQAHHRACDAVLAQGGHFIYQHALAEVFSILTGGRLGRRVEASTAAQLLEASVLPLITVVSLSAGEFMAALNAAHARGVRGGAVYDWLHLAAARKAKTEAVLTLNVRDFQALAQRGDPLVRAP